MVVCPGGQMGEFVWVLINDMKSYSEKWCFGWNSRWEPQVIRQTRHDISQPFDIRLVPKNIHLSNSWVVMMIHEEEDKIEKKEKKNIGWICKFTKKQWPDFTYIIVSFMQQDNRKKVECFNFVSFSTSFAFTYKK